MRCWRTLLIFGLLFVGPALAQDGNPADAARVLYDFELEVEDGPHYVKAVTGWYGINITFRDNSRDDPSTVDPNLPRLGVQGHTVSLTAVPEGPSEGWIIDGLSSFQSIGGQEWVQELRVQAAGAVKSPHLIVNVTAVINTQAGQFVRTALVEYISPGVAGFQVSYSANFDGMRGDEVRSGTLTITNAKLEPRLFTIDVGSNPCNLKVAVVGSTMVLPRGSSEISFSVRGPDDQFYSVSRDCSVSLAVSPLESEVSRTVPLNIVINGFYVNPEWIIWTCILGAIFLAIIYVVAARKRRIEEEILGKPQKPWTIPVERLYLARLKEKDERAWYVVRHHLMEEEYQSAMLWYKEYKKGTKGSRSKERIILKHEHAYERWQARVESRLAKPARRAEKYRARLQRKLDRKARRQTIKLRAKADKQNKQLQAAHDKQHARATEKWQKQAAKAEKKGLEVPDKPVTASPELQERPDAVALPLASHRWNKKAERKDLKMDKKELRLKNKLHREEKKQLAKLRRKVERIGRKLDDPDFLAEHGLA